MTHSEITAYFRLFVFCFLVVIGVTQCVYQKDTIAAIRAVGVQCNAEFTIEIPDTENIKMER